MCRLERDHILQHAVVGYSMANQQQTLYHWLICSQRNQINQKMLHHQYPIQIWHNCWSSYCIYRLERDQRNHRYRHYWLRQQQIIVPSADMLTDQPKPSNSASPLMSDPSCSYVEVARTQKNHLFYNPGSHKQRRNEIKLCERHGLKFSTSSKQNSSIISVRSPASSGSVTWYTVMPRRLNFASLGQEW